MITKNVSLFARKFFRVQVGDSKWNPQTAAAERLKDDVMFLRGSARVSSRLSRISSSLISCLVVRQGLGSANQDELAFVRVSGMSYCVACYMCTCMRMCMRSTWRNRMPTVAADPGMLVFRGCYRLTVADTQSQTHTHAHTCKQADTKPEAVPRMTSSAVNGFQSQEFSLSVRPEEAQATDHGNPLKSQSITRQRIFIRE